jgi:Lectin C-type domain
MCRLLPIVFSALLVGCAGDLTPPPQGDGQLQSDGGACDHGTYFQGYCYFTAGLSSMDYPTAKKYCIAGGAEPASIHSMALNNLIFQMMLKIRDGVWIGLVRSGNSFAWEDGTKLDYTNWAPGEPDERDCAVMVGPFGTQGQQGMWADSRCSSMYEEIICQKKP